MTERLYRGNCLTPEQLKATLERFRSKRAAIDACSRSCRNCSPDRAKKMKKFFDDFWKRIDDPRGLAERNRERLPEKPATKNRLFS